MDRKTILRDSLVFGFPLVGLIYLVNQWSLVIDRTHGFRDYWTLFWEASGQYGLDFWLGKVSILGRGSFGSATFLQFAPWAFVLVLSCWVGQTLWRKYRNEEAYWYFWSNGIWAAYSIMWIFVSMGFAAIAHYLNLYSMPVPCGEGCEVAGTVDWITHFFSPSIFTVTLLMVSWYDIFKWKGRWGRFKEAIWILLLVCVVMFFWEYGECGNPAVYRNLYWDSVKDLFMGFFGSAFCVAMYNLIVPFED